VKIGVLGESSKKGSSRKHTENRVARWDSLFWGNLRFSRCFAKRILLGELGIGGFWIFRRCSHVGKEEGGRFVLF
jgi:hypothetical protein